MMDQLYSQQLSNQGQQAAVAGKLANSAVIITTPLSDPSNEKNAKASEHLTSFKSELSNTTKSQETISSKAVATPDSLANEESEQEFGFLDFLDIINPLQHIPVVSTIYREITGDEIKAPARVFGGMIFGGPSGFVSAIANSIVEETTGKDIGANVMEAFLGPDEAEDQIQVAKINNNANEIATLPAESSTQNVATKNEPGFESAALFTQLAPIVPPAPKTTPSATASTSKIKSDTAALEGQDALAALYSDVKKARNSSKETLATHSREQLHQTEASDSALKRGNAPGKWFPLSGANVLVAQATEIPPITAQKPVIDSSPAPTQISSNPQDNFAQNLLNGLDKYQQFKKQ